MPTDLNFYQCSRNIVDDDLCPYLHSAVVFLDDPFAEVIHWHGGATTLFNVGAIEVREFSSFESGNANQSKAVFCLGVALSSGSVLDTILTIIDASSFLEVFVITTVPSPMHSIIEYGPANIADDDSRAFRLFESQILKQLQQKMSGRCSVEIVYLPLVIAPIIPSFFTVPSFGDVFPLLPTDTDEIQHGPAKGAAIPGSSIDIDFASLSRQLQLKLKLLACGLDSMLLALGCSEDVFALGPTSNVVAAELAALSWAKARKKNAQQRASLLLVDRTLDIASVVGHFHDSILDKMAAVLPRLPGHQSDILVDMSPICTITSNEDYRVIAPGCLAHPDDPVATSLLNTLGILKHKEALMEINRHVAEAAVKESLIDKTSIAAQRPGKAVGVDVIQSHVAAFRGKAGSVRRHCGLLQLALATTQLLQSSRLPTLDSLLAEEKGLLQCFGDDDAPSPASQVIRSLRKQLQLPVDERSHSVDDILQLLAFIFSLAGDGCSVSQVEIEELKSVFYDALCRSRTTCGDIFQQLVGKDDDEIKISKAVYKALEKLRNLSRARDGFKRYRDIYEPGSISSQARLKPLLRQIIDDIVDPTRPELTDIAHKSAGFGDLLKSGFGLFRAVSKPRPGDQPLLIIFVLGGATSTEVRQVRDAVAASKTNFQVVVGSTALVTPSDVLQRILLQDNLHPNTAI